MSHILTHIVYKKYLRGCNTKKTEVSRILSASFLHVSLVYKVGKILTMIVSIGYWLHIYKK